VATPGKERLKKRAGKVPVMERILIYIKHNLRFLWKLIELSNGLLFAVFFEKKLYRYLHEVFTEFALPPYDYRVLHDSEAKDLFNLIEQQDISDLEHFKPHEFDLRSIMKQFQNRALLMMGVFDQDKLIGYFFLRFFINRKCFVGRIIDRSYRGKGIGINMNRIMYEISWRMEFRCLSTISLNNKNVLKAHANNQAMNVIRKLPNDYLLVEFLREGSNK
jgi:RimJ/RimL family protein N-acetyltransferase